MRLLRSTVAALALLFCPLLLPAQTPQADRIPADADLALTAPVPHLVPAWATAANTPKAVRSDTPLRLTFVLARSPERQAAFTQLLEDQQNPASAGYHHWLTPQQAGELYGPTQHDIDALSTWLNAQGMATVEIAPSRLFLTVAAPAATVAAALHTSFQSFSVAGQPRLSATADPALPAVFVPLIQTITGLSNAPLEPMHHFEAHPLSDLTNPSYTGTTGTHYVTPGDFSVIYNLAPAGLTGTGQKVAIIGRSRVASGDVTQFESLMGLPTNLPNVVIPTTGVDPGISATGDQGEAILDVGRVLGTAPNAQADLVVSASTANSDGVSIAAQYEVQTLLDPVMNISFGSCEVYNGAAGVSYWDTLFAQAASQGISVFISSADSGAATCGPQFGTPPAYQFRAINVICASSYATCVGATEFNDTAAPTQYWSTANSSTFTSALSYIPEGAWNDPTATSNGATIFISASTGGGASIYVPKPTWQTGVGVPADNARDVPDISLSGARHDGYFSCYAASGGDCSAGHFVSFSGTSAAAPGLAGITALLNQKTGGRQGNLNPLLYRLANTNPAVFHDATPATSGVSPCDIGTASMCNNSTPSPTGLTGGLAGYALTTGYDQATGLGSPNISTFLTAAAAVTPSTLTPTRLIVTADHVSITDNGTNGVIDALPTTAVFTATLTTTTGTPTGTVQFFANQKPLGAPVPLTSSQALTAPLPFPAAGNYLITALYSGDTSFAAATAPGISLLVTGFRNTVTLDAARPSITLGASDTFTATVTPTTVTFTPPVTQPALPTPTGLVRFYTPYLGYFSTVPLINGVATTAPASLPVATTYDVYAFYLGDTVYSASSTLLKSAVTVTPIPTTAQITSAPATLAINATTNITATVTGASAAALESTPTSLITLLANGKVLVNGNLSASTGTSATVTFTGISFPTAGTQSLTVSYLGDLFYAASTSPAVVLTVGAAPATFQVTAATPSLTVAVGNSGTDTLTLASTNGYAGTVGLTCAIAYNGTGTATYPPTCTLPSAQLTLSSTTTSAPDILSIATTTPHAALTPLSLPTHSSPWSFAPAALALLLCLLPRTRRHLPNLLATLFLTVTLTLAGCSSKTPTPVLVGTSTGSYTITITATPTTGTATTLTIPLTVQ